MRNTGIGLLLVQFFFPDRPENGHVLYTCLFYAGLSAPFALPGLLWHRRGGTAVPFRAAFPRPEGPARPLRGDRMSALRPDDAPDPEAQHTALADARAKAAAALEATAQRYALVRLFLFLGAGIFFAAGVSQDSTPIALGGVLCAAIFAGVAIAHARVLTRRDEQLAREAVHRRHVHRATLAFHELPGARRRDPPRGPPLRRRHRPGRRGLPDGAGSTSAAPARDTRRSRSGSAPRPTETRPGRARRRSPSCAPPWSCARSSRPPAPRPRARSSSTRRRFWSSSGASPGSSRAKRSSPSPTSAR